MPLSPGEFFDHAAAAFDAEGRLAVPAVAGWETFPFEPDNLRVVRLEPPRLPEPPRAGETGGRPCFACSRDGAPIWHDENWKLSTLGDPTGAPLLLMLESLAHLDLIDLSDEMAGELGRLTVHIARAIEGLPHIARAHVSRWGDGGSHLHVFFYARPAGFAQLRGTCLAIWDDILPALPADVVAADAAAVADALSATYGGGTA